MIIDRYAPMNLFELLPQLGLELDPVLAELDVLLDDDVLFQAVRADLVTRYPHSACRGRHATPVEVILRMLVVRRLYDWSYADTERFVADSVTLRQFCRVYLAPVPDDTTLIRWARLIEPETLEQLNARVVELATHLTVTRGRKLRVDGTVVATNIHHPTDASLLGDGVRVLSRLVRRAKGLIDASLAAPGAVFRDRTRAAKRGIHQIGVAARRAGAQGADAFQAAYAHLLDVARASCRQAAAVSALLARQATTRAQTVADELAHYTDLVGRVIEQTRRRVLAGEVVPASEKVVSLFEPHTVIIRRRAASHATMFGRKVWLDEVDGGIISGYRVLEGNPPDVEQLAPSLDHHVQCFGHPPWLVAADRGVYSEANERRCQAAGIRRVVVPKPGAKPPARQQHERQRWFRRGLRFRAGIEGRIGVLKRRGWLGRCRERGAAGFQRWIGWGVVTANLAMIARTLAAR